MSYFRYLLVLLLLLLAGLILLGLSTRKFEYSYEVVMPVRYDTVWTDLSVFDSLPNWYPGLISVKLDSGNYDQAPSKYTWTLMRDGQEVDYTVSMVKRDRLDSLTYIHYLPEAEKRVTWAMEQLMNMNTRVTGYYEWQPYGFIDRIFYRFNSLNLGFEDLQTLEALRDRYREIDAGRIKK